MSHPPSLPPSWSQLSDVFNITSKKSKELSDIVKTKVYTFLLASLFENILSVLTNKIKKRNGIDAEPFLDTQINWEIVHLWNALPIIYFYIWYLSRFIIYAYYFDQERLNKICNNN